MSDTYPKITKEYTLDMLTETSVSVITKTFIQLAEGLETQTVGKPIRTSYMNNPSGRSAIQAELPENFVSGIFAVWGETSVIPDVEAPNNVEER